MARYITITTWKPENARALNMRYNDLITGKAPKEVIEGFAKIKLITTEISLGSRTSFMIYEADDEDTVTTNVVSMYFQEVCHQVTYPVLSFEDYLKVRKLMPPEKMPKPEKPWKD
ncbi:MAG: hypothetical protein HWN66_14920 [Candidatus Helarchaeota archaeon]|nr:hypothetical protein [Candidatus Helarchaeota archaeon]